MALFQSYLFDNMGLITDLTPAIKLSLRTKLASWTSKRAEEHNNTKTAEYTFFSSAHGTFSRIDHMLGHKASLGKFKKTEIVSSISSNHSAMRLEINYKKKLQKTQTCGG